MKKESSCHQKTQSTLIWLSSFNNTNVSSDEDDDFFDSDGDRDEVDNNRDDISDLSLLPERWNKYYFINSVKFCWFFALETIKKLKLVKLLWSH